MKFKKITSFVLAASMGMAMFPTVANAMQIFVNVKTENGKTFSIEVESGDSINNIMGIIALQEGIHPGSYTLEFGNRTLEEGRTLAGYNIQKGSIVDLVHIKNITLGDYALKSGQNSNVYLGTYKQSSDSNGGYLTEPIKWRVLDNCGEKMFLLSDKNLDVVQYNTEDCPLTWTTSSVRAWLNGYAANMQSEMDYSDNNFIDTAFSEEEQNIIVDTSGLDANGATDKVFFLSLDEGKIETYGFTGNKNATDTRKALNTAYVANGGSTGNTSLGMYAENEADYWWLRSHNNSSGIDYVGDDGYLNSGNYAFAYQAARPALNLDSSKVLFATPAYGKPVNVGTFSKNETYNFPQDGQYEYKLTMIDSERDFTVAESSVALAKDGYVTINYQDAQVGVNEYISAILMNKSNEVLYYGQVANITDDAAKSGRVEISVPSELPYGTYELRIFNEQINGDCRTDFSSDFETVDLEINPKNIMSGKSVFSYYNSANGYDYIYYGTYNNNPIKWRVLTANGNGGTYTDGNGNDVNSSNAMFMLSEYCLENMIYDETNNGPDISIKDWSDSNIREWGNSTADTGFIKQSFSENEQKMLLKTSKRSNGENPDEQNEDVFFALSKGEAESDYIKKDRAAKTSGNGATVGWWLRTMSGYEKAYYVDAHGGIYDSIINSNYTVRPAFNLNTTSVLFTTASNGGKNVNVGELTENMENPSREFKLTLLDENRANFSVVGSENGENANIEKTGAAGKKISLSYKGATTGENEYISAMILNDVGDILYYGQVANVASEDMAEGAIDIKIPGGIANGTYEMRVFNEQINGDCKTDVSSDFETVTLNVKKTSGSSGGGGGVAIPVTYNVVFDSDGGNDVATQKVEKNEKAIKPKTPIKEGFEFGGWFCDKEREKEFDFDTNVTKNITLYAKWLKTEYVVEPTEEPTESVWKNPFGDVSADDWFFEAVKYANKNGLMSGVTNTVFAPDLTLTRGMLVTIFYRMAGEPEVNKSIPFADVMADSYYAKAVIWAQQNGIITGISETEFAPEDEITREQIAVILHRYANENGYDVSEGESTNILSYEDFGEISEYAIEAMQYAVGYGIMTGKTENTLNPKDNATRAEIAAILQRFIEQNK